MTAMLRLDPPLPVQLAETGAKALAHALIDYGVEFNLLFVIAMDESREIWVVDNTKLRVQSNLTFGRKPKARNDLPCE